MFNKVLFTISTRILTAMLSIVNVLIGTNYLGVEGYGTIALIVLGITIYLMIQNLITGSSIIYFISKFEPSAIVVMSYIWVIVSAGIFLGLIYTSHYLGIYFNWSFEIVPKEFIWHNIFLACGYGLMAIHLNVLLGRERIKAYNLIFLIQHVIATILLVVFYVLLKKESIGYYLVALYVSYFIAFLSAFVFTLNYIKSFHLPSFPEFKSMLKYGALGQSANIFQLINYRMSYYLIDIFVGRAGLGIFSAATQISEGLWIFGKSIATVQFARISNSKEYTYARTLSLRLLKFTTSLTLLPLLVLLFMPIDFYTFLLGPEFTEVRTIIRLMALGTISLTASMILSHYFSGVGQIGKNTVGSGIGVVFTIALGFLVVPYFGMNGAAMVTSMSYSASLIYLIVQFNKETHFPLAEWLPNKSDIKESIELIRSKFS
jgi:O-antigen/teichoic acid export membrane protein